MIRALIALALALIASPAMAGSAAPAARVSASPMAKPAVQTVTIRDAQRMTWWGKWTCMITDQGGAPKGGEGNAIAAQKGTGPISFIASHNYSTGYKWGIRTYNFCQYGGGRGVKSTPSLAIRVGDAGKLKQPFSWQTQPGMTGNFNVLGEAFLTETPTDYSSGKLEVGFQLRDDYALNQWLGAKWAKTCKQPCEPGKTKAKFLGGFVDHYSHRWTVTAAGGPAGPLGYINIRPAFAITGSTASQTTMNEGVLPWGEALAFLVRTGIAKPGWYLQGVFFGVEVTSGKATVHVSLSPVE